MSNPAGAGPIAAASTIGARLRSAPRSLAVHMPVLSSGITVTDTIPVGYNNLIVTAGPEWSVTLSSTTSPAVLTAVYVGPFPVLGGVTLPTISVTGTLNAFATPNMTSSASVSTAGYTSTAANTSADTIVVIVAKPDLAITLTHDEGNHYQSGQKIVYQLNVQDMATAGPVTVPGTIVVTFVIPVGLRHIQVVGYDWNVISSSDMSPTLTTATYFGPYPVQPGQALPPLFVSGQLTEDASPDLTTTAVVGALNDADPANNIAYDTVFVARRKDQHHEHDQHHQPNNHDNHTNHNGSDGENGNNGNNGENGNNGSSSRSSNAPSLPATGGSPFVVVDTKP